MCEQFDLYFGSVKIGAVTQTYSDFPSLWGDIAYDPALTEPQTAEAARLVRFIDLSRESVRLADMEPEHDTSQEQEAVSAELETYYTAYVESQDWHLIDKRGHKLPILCPIFREDSEVVWRWNPGVE